MAKEYIERGAAIDDIEGITWYHVNTRGNLVKGAISDGNALYKADDLFDVLKKLPAADVVEVVRCKDCKYWRAMDNGISWQHIGRTDGECKALWKFLDAERHLTEEEHFCSYGERKEQE